MCDNVTFTMVKDVTKVVTLYPSHYDAHTTEIDFRKRNNVERGLDSIHHC